MKRTIFVKTFLTLFVSFTLVFLLSSYLSYRQFSPKYINENINAVKEAIQNSASLIENGTDLKDTELYTISRSETQFIRVKNDVLTEDIGPDYLTELELIDFVIDIYLNNEAITEENLIYTITQQDDVYQISYLYEYGLGDYLIVSTKIQSLSNIEMVLIDINTQQSIYLFLMVIALSIIISKAVSNPVKKINKYAKEIAELKFDSELQIKSKDEFQDLVGSLNEMTFNLKQSYNQLETLNKKLSHDIDYEKEQEEKKKQLIMTINHELKTPLAVMKGMIEGMIDGVGRYQDKDKYLPELIQQIETVENITKDLTYSLMLEDKAKKDTVCQSTIIFETLNALTEFANQRMVKLKKDIKEATLSINEELYIILVSNLIKNAILYTSNDIVEVTTIINQDTYTFLVRNKGTIPEKDISKIFDSFYRANHIQIKKEGQGLGLFIVKQICELYGFTYKIFNDNGYVVAKVDLNIKSH